MRGPLASSVTGGAFCLHKHSSRRQWPSGQPGSTSRSLAEAIMTPRAKTGASGEAQAQHSTTCDDSFDAPSQVSCNAVCGPDSAYRGCPAPSAAARAPHAPAVLPVCPSAALWRVAWLSMAGNGSRATFSTLLGRATWENEHTSFLQGEPARKPLLARHALQVRRHSSVEQPPASPRAPLPCENPTNGHRDLF